MLARMARNCLDTYLTVVKALTICIPDYKSRILDCLLQDTNSHIKMLPNLKTRGCFCIPVRLLVPASGAKPASHTTPVKMHYSSAPLYGGIHHRVGKQSRKTGKTGSEEQSGREEMKLEGRRGGLHILFVNSRKQAITVPTACFIIRTKDPTPEDKANMKKYQYSTKQTLHSIVNFLFQHSLLTIT